MQKDNSWNPGHSTKTGYPFDGIVTQEFLKNRVDVSQGKDFKIYVDINTEVFGTVKDTGTRTELEDFLLLRLFDYSEALNIAEGQIKDILHEDPFAPETFGFELVFKNKEITEPHVRVYVSKFDNRITLFRKPSSPMDKGWNPASWTIQTKQEDGTFNEVNVLLPCHRIAYAVLYSLGIKVKDAGKEGNAGPASSLTLKHQKKP